MSGNFDPVTMRDHCIHSAQKYDVSPEETIRIAQMFYDYLVNGALPPVAPAASTTSADRAE